jgi:hypothetical protein
MASSQKLFQPRKTNKDSFNAQALLASSLVDVLGVCVRLGFEVH